MSTRYPTQPQPAFEPVLLEKAIGHRSQCRRPTGYILATERVITRRHDAQQLAGQPSRLVEGHDADPVDRCPVHAAGWEAVLNDERLRASRRDSDPEATNLTVPGHELLA